jgi:hypothetical protein
MYICTYCKPAKRGQNSNFPCDDPNGYADLLGRRLAELVGEHGEHVEQLPNGPALAHRVGDLSVHTLQAPQCPCNAHQPRVVLIQKIT